MSHVSEFVIVDTSCLILLSKNEGLFILKELTDKLYITPEIHSEFGRKIPQWIKIKIPTDKKVALLGKYKIDRGEASAIALAMDFEHSLLIIDDLKGRKWAEKFKLNYTGTFGVLLNAKRFGIIPEIKPFIEKTRLTNFHISDQLLTDILLEAGE